MSELDQTIEELESEVLAELEEASQPDDTGGKSDAPKKVKDEVNDVEDLGGADPEAKVEKDADEDREEKAIGKKASAAAKAIKGDAQQKSAGKSDAPQKLAAGDEVMHDGEKISEEDIEEKMSTISVAEDVKALIDGENLSEEFKIKAATIFEAAVKSKIRSEVVRMEEDYVLQLSEATETIKEELSTKVDDYLGYVVEEWMKENEIAIERGLKGEIAEDFISGLKQLFEDHYIDVPDEKYDILEAQAEKISELEEKLNNTIEENVDRRKVVESLTKEAIMHDVSEDLTVTEIEKFKSLTEELDFVSEESFRHKLDTLKESYFPKTGGEESFLIDYDNSELAQDIDTTGAMKSYMSAISRTKLA
jgi:hypothetical protein